MVVRSEGVAPGGEKAAERRVGHWDGGKSPVFDYGFVHCSTI